MGMDPGARGRLTLNYHIFFSRVCPRTDRWTVKTSTQIKCGPRGLVLSILFYQVQEFLLDLVAKKDHVVGAIVPFHRIKSVDPDVGGLEFLAL